jgi:hypothetical protein
LPRMIDTRSMTARELIPSSWAALLRMPLLFSSAASICSSVATFRMVYFDAELFAALVGRLSIYLGFPLQMAVDESVLFFVY